MWSDKHKTLTIRVRNHLRLHIIKLRETLTTLAFDLPYYSRSQNIKSSFALLMQDRSGIPVTKQMLNNVSDANVRQE